MYQPKYEELVDFKKSFTAVAEVLDHIDSDLSELAKGITNKIIKNSHSVDRKDATDAQIEVAGKIAKNRLLAGIFLEVADFNR